MLLGSWHKCASGSAGGTHRWVWGGTGSAGLCSEAAGLQGMLLGQRCAAANVGRQETAGRHPGTALPSRSNAKRCDWGHRDTSLYFQGVLWGNSDKAVCNHEIAVYGMYFVKNFNIDDRWIIFFSQNQGGLDSVDFSVNFDALIYIFLITVKTGLLRDRQTFPWVCFKYLGSSCLLITDEL